MQRRTLFAAALALGVAGCAPAPAASPSPAPGSSATGRAVIGLSYIPNVQFAPFYVGEAKSLYAGVGAPVTLRHHGATEGLFNALSSGAEDFLVAGGAEAMQARAQGLDVIAVGAYYKRFPVEIITLGTSPIRSLRDLKGRKLGVPGRYGESWLGVQVALQTAGLTAKDVEIVEVGYTQVAALTTNKVAAVAGFRTNELVQLRTAGVAPRALVVAPDPVPLVSTCLLTTSAYAKAHPEVVRGVVAATAQAIGATAANQGGAIDVAATRIPGWTAAQRPNAEAVLAASVELMDLAGGSFGPELDAKQWARMATLLDQRRLITKPVAASSAFTNDFAG